MVERGDMDLAEVNEGGQTVIHVAAGHRHCHEVGIWYIHPCCKIEIVLKVTR